MNRLFRVILALALAGGAAGAGCGKKQAAEEKRRAAEMRAVIPELGDQQALAARQEVERAYQEVLPSLDLKPDLPKEARTLLLDLGVLTKTPHRLAGDPEGSLRAAQFVEHRLQAMGVKLVTTQQFSVAEPVASECTLEADGRRYDVFALRPNLLQCVVTPPEGLTGQTLYAGAGRLSDYPDRADGRIVVLDFSAGDRWQDAFGMGAKAVVFIGQDEPAPNACHHMNFAADLPRFYVPAELADRLQLRGRPQTVTLRAAARWEMRQGRNVIGILRGSDPRFPKKDQRPEDAVPEAIVLAAGLDSLSEVPLLSPGARGAANCAGLLGVAERLLANPPRRDVVLCFFDGESIDHAGARAFYGALYRTKISGVAALGERAAMLEDEQAYLRGVQDVLAVGDIFSPEAARLPGQRSAEYMMRTEAKALSGAIRDQTQLERTARLGLTKRLRELKSPGVVSTQPGADGALAQLSQEDAAKEAARCQAETEAIDARIEPLKRQIDQWSVAERALADRRCTAESQEKYQVVLEQSKQLCGARQDELAVMLQQAEQGQRLINAIGEGRALLVMHLSMNLGDESPRWTLIHGNDSMTVHDSPDRPGQYNTIFQRVQRIHKDAQAAGEPLDLFEVRTTEGVYDIRMFAPGLFAHSGSVAGLFGISNLAVMTPMDRRLRDGQPCDVVSRPGPGGRRVPVLKTDNLLAALGEFGRFVELTGNVADAYSTSGIKPVATFTETKFSGDRVSSGARAMMVSASSAMADFPAREALVTVMRRGNPKVWEGQRADLVPAGFQPFSIARVDVNGRFEFPPLSEPYMKYAAMVGAMFDERGLVDYVSTTRTAFPPLPFTNVALNLFRSSHMTAVGMGYDRGAIATRALRAASTAPLSDDQSLVCESGNALTVYAPRGLDLLKVFNSDGMMVLGNAPPADPVLGRGLPLDPFAHWPSVALSAGDGYRLNDGRLTVLRNNRILEPSLDRMHSESLELREKAQAMPAGQVERRVATMEAAAAMNRRVYKPLLGVLNDLVVAVVLLLLLAIPFAYALERLLVGTPHIYRQIAWFVVFFLVTFALLFLVNPAFRIASTPIVIFLAFAIILLSALVIVIMSRKLQVEVKRMQGLGTTVHSSDVSRLGTMMAAVQMGISTMRRRRIRTLLTAATVVLLTFTILTFASFGSAWGIRKTYIGPVSGPPRILVRHPLWSRITEQIPEMLSGLLADQAEVVPMWWVSQTAGEVQDFTVAGRTKQYLVGDAEGRNIASLSAMVGLDTRDLTGQPELREVLTGDVDGLGADGVFLTDAVVRELKVQPGDPVVVDGIRCRLAGTIDLRRITGYRLLEGSSTLPVDYQSSGGGTALAFQAKESAALQDLPETESAQFIAFSPDKVAVIPAELARRLGGRVCSLTAYPKAEGTDLEQIGNQIATVSGLPTYIGARGGVYRLFFTTLTEASGWRDLVIPVILGGLIIFATMLGSVSDREKEIYAFSALGLAPPHVASLFFAEASVYAVVGGMGGYLLGQIVARGLSIVMPNAPTMNYSSTNAVATILVVMATVLVSTIYPAIQASKSANPGIQRTWRIGRPKEDLYDIVFPFTVSAYDITGVVSFLKEHFENYSDTALGVFATSHVHLFRRDSGLLGIQAQVALAPFDLGVSQRFVLMAQPSEIEGIQEVRILLRRLSGTRGDWQRANRVFINELRKQFLIWRAVAPEVMEQYRQNTLRQWNALPVEDVRAETFAASAGEPR